MTNEELAAMAEGDDLCWGGLTHAEWVHVAQVIMRWPRLGACDAATSQALVAGINERLVTCSLIDQENRRG